MIRKIANFRFQTEENVYWNEKEVFFQSFNYNSATILFQEKSVQMTKTVPKSELCKFQLGSIRRVKKELEDSSLILH